MNNGVANRFNFKEYELIEINWRLTEYPSLYKRVFEHEVEHASGGYKTKDLIHDLKSKTPGLHKFMFMNPSSLTQLLPFYWDGRRKQWFYDVSAIVMTLIGIGICTGVFFVMRWLL